MILSKAEKEYLQGEKPLSTGYNSVLKGRIRKKLIDAFGETALICKNIEKISPAKTEEKKKFKTQMNKLCQGI